MHPLLASRRRSGNAQRATHSYRNDSIRSPPSALLFCESLDVPLLALSRAAASNPVSKAKAAAKSVKKGSAAVAKKTRKIHTSVHFNRPKTLILARAPKYQRNSLPGRAKLDKYRVIKSPCTTESAMKKIEENNTLTFICDVQASKTQIRAAVKSLYDVAVAQVNTLIRCVAHFFLSTLCSPTRVCVCIICTPTSHLLVPLAVFSLSSMLSRLALAFLSLYSPDGQKKAYVRLAGDVDALDVANRIGII